MYYSLIGRIEQVEGVVCVVTNKGEQGYPVYGPYVPLDPGSYEAEFHVMPHELNNAICCILDIYRAANTVVTEKDFTSNELIRRGGVAVVRFEVIARDIFEFRVQSTGASGLTIEYNRPLRIVPDPRQ